MPTSISHTSTFDSTSLTYPWTIWGLAILLIVLPYLVEIIFVQLANKACKVAVFEMFRKNRLREFLILLTN
jgi:hypothetical protein